MIVNKLQQRTDYTHKYNRDFGRHGWLRLTPAYSLKVVDELIRQQSKATRVLDPFCGSGTTALCSAVRGIPAVTTDINPFLVWLTKTKTENYNDSTIRNEIKFASSVRESKNTFENYAPPKIHNIERWWTANVIKFFCQLRNSIETDSLNNKIKNILKIAFCRTLIKLSNASFDH